MSMTASGDAAQDLRRVVLLVEDEDAVRRSLQLFLTGRGYHVRAYSAAATLLADKSLDGAGLLVADYRLPDSSGIRLLTTMRQRGWRGRAILMTGHGCEELEGLAREAGFETLMGKPLRHQQLLSALEGGER
ncbi:response regulator [Sphingomonas sp. IC-11]|nr:response regulator [Sphingomonas sp. IC-11]